jgi:hypothetical protein
MLPFAPVAQSQPVNSVSITNTVASSPLAGSFSRSRCQTRRSFTTTKTASTKPTMSCTAITHASCGSPEKYPMKPVAARTATMSARPQSVPRGVT